MNPLDKLRETALSVLPVMGVVALLGTLAVPLGAGTLGRFALGGLLLIAGLSAFLLGVDIGIQPMGERAGAELTRRRNLPLLLGATFAIGFVVTAAEPDIQVFGDQVSSVFPAVRKTVFTGAIATGVALFMVLGMLRTVLRLKLRAALLVSYGLLAAAALLVPRAFVGVAFDAGGATTGPMTVPFILALGIGVARVRSDPNASFGLTGLASVGPVLAVLVYAAALRHGGDASGAQTAVAPAAAATGLFAPFRDALPDAAREALLSIAPLYALFLLFRATLVRMPLVQFLRQTVGFAYACIGLVLFLTGVAGGFLRAGAELGAALGARAAGSGGWGWCALLVGTGVLLGAIAVFAEPAVWVLGDQVEKATGGTIPRRMLLLCLSTATGIAIGLALWRAMAGFPLAAVLLPGYLLALLLMPWTPTLFVGIAFDSGGVASGPLTSTFILSFALGAASASRSGGNDVFGVIALVAMMPLVTLQAMGILYRRARRRKGLPA